MSCSKQDGPQAFIGFVSDATGETLSQQDWHDCRELAEELGGDMSRERVSAEEAIATLKALDAKLKEEAVAEKKFKDGLRTGSIPNEEEAIDETYKRFVSQAGKDSAKAGDIRKRIFDAFESATPPPAPKPAPKPTAQPVPSVPTIQQYERAEAAVSSAKVTRGTLTVMRMFVEVGVKPLLALVRARREEAKASKASAKRINKEMKKIRARRGY